MPIGITVDYRNWLPSDVSLVLYGPTGLPIGEMLTDRCDIEVNYKVMGVGEISVVGQRDMLPRSVRSESAWAKKVAFWSLRMHEYDICYGFFTSRTVQHGLSGEIVSLKGETLNGVLSRMVVIPSNRKTDHLYGRCSEVLRRLLANNQGGEDIGRVPPGVPGSYVTDELSSEVINYDAPRGQFHYDAKAGSNLLATAQDVVSYFYEQRLMFDMRLEQGEDTQERVIVATFRVGADTKSYLQFSLSAGDLTMFQRTESAPQHAQAYAISSDLEKWHYACDDNLRAKLRSQWGIPCSEKLVNAGTFDDSTDWNGTMLAEIRGDAHTNHEMTFRVSPRKYRVLGHHYQMGDIVVVSEPGLYMDIGVLSGLKVKLTGSKLEIYHTVSVKHSR